MGNDYTAPHWDRAALITIDTQRDVLDGEPVEIPGTSAVLPAIGRLCEGFRACGLPVTHIVRMYLLDGSNAEPCRRRMIEEGRSILVPGTAGAQLAPGLLSRPQNLDVDLLLAGGVQEIGPDEAVIFKPRWGAFYETALQAHLKTAGVTTLVFAGCNFPNCPRTSVYEASERDYRLVVVTDAISGLYERGVEELTNIGASLMTTDQVIRAVAAAPSAPSPSTP
jgi:nicotinamidase-related amidase